MKIQLLNGGLGNQVFQYIFARYMELTTGDTVYLDDSFFYLTDAHNGYEIEKVFPHSCPRLLSRELKPNVWHYLIENCKKGISLCQSIKDSGTDLFIIAETGDFSFDGNYVMVPPQSFTPAIAYSQGNPYYHGYWIQKQWLYSFPDPLFKELSFPDIPDSKNQEYLRQIQETDSVAVHIRRGDFLDLNWDIPDSFYHASITKICELLPNAELFIFSDDIVYCKTHISELGFDLPKKTAIFVDGNTSGANYIDLQLMSYCKGMVISRSSFSYLAALLNQREDKFVINPFPGREI